MLSSGGFGGNFIGNIQEQESNYQKRGRNLSVRCNIYKIVHFSNSFSILTTTNNSSIPKKISPVKTIAPAREVISAKFGVMNATPNQPADRFANNAESARSHGLVKKIRIDPTVSEPNMRVNFSIC